jgi:hypothetical protein
MTKTLLTCLTLAGCIIGGNAQTTFTLAQTKALTGSDNPYAIATDLIDNDAFADILYASSGNGTFSWLKNDGTGQFADPVVIGSGYYFPNAVAIADINADGYNDVVLCDYAKVVWFPNDQAGGFGAEQPVATVNGAAFILVRKIDAGTTLDIAVSSYLGNKVVWFSNNGSAPYFDGTEHIIDNTIASPVAFDMADIDGNGSIDAVISNSIGNTPGSVDSRIDVFYNDGASNFTKDTNPVADNTKEYMSYVVLADVDNDTDIDILSSDLYGNVSWYNRTEVSPGTATYSENVFTTSIANPAAIAFKDLDNDGLKDVVLSSGTSGAGNDIVWYKNNDAGSFNSEAVIDATQSQAFVMDFEDFDNDGDLDITSAAYNNDTVKIFDNDKIQLSLDDFNTNKLKFYPNPATGKLNFEGTTPENFKITVFDMLEKKAMETTINVGTSLDISKLQAGIYILKFNDFNKTFKFVKE